MKSTTVVLKLAAVAQQHTTATEPVHTSLPILSIDALKLEQVPQMSYV